MEKEIASFSKNRTELVKVRLLDFKEKRYVDIRVFLKPGEGDRGAEEEATGKGITIHVDHLPELQKALELAEAAIDENTWAAAKEGLGR
jgi:hypothetical protein